MMFDLCNTCLNNCSLKQKYFILNNNFALIDELLGCICDCDFYLNERKYKNVEKKGKVY